MGLNYETVRTLLEYRGAKHGGQVASLGRLSINLHPREIADLRSRFAAAHVTSWLDTFSWGEYCERFFTEAMKFDSVSTIDFSDYEGASLVYDIGRPIDASMYESFDLLVDGGTIEHVFDVKTALSNVMNLTKVGGAVYTLNPCNSMSGHGFYQFSPELAFRVFSDDNGFSVVSVRLVVSRQMSVERTEFAPVYEVIDPSLLGMRVALADGRPTLLATLAERTTRREPFVSPVLQSDYQVAWANAGGDKPKLNWKGQMVERLRALSPRVYNEVSRRYWLRQASLRNSRAYKRVW